MFYLLLNQLFNILNITNTKITIKILMKLLLILTLNNDMIKIIFDTHLYINILDSDNTVREYSNI